MITAYDKPTEQTVADYFDTKQQAKAYIAIRELEITTIRSYRPASRTKGKGSKLYLIEDLQRVEQSISASDNELPATLPNSMIDTKMICAEYSVTAYAVSVLFGLLDMVPVGYYKPGKRKVGYFSVRKVAMVMSGVEEMKQNLEEEE